MKCPRCQADFGTDSFAFINHLKNCDGGPGRKPVETRAARDARMLEDAELEAQDFTSYERSLWNRGERKAAIASQRRRLGWAAKKKTGGSK